MFTGFATTLLCFAMAASSLSPPLTSSHKKSLEQTMNPPDAVEVSSLLDTIPFHTWDDAAASLLEKGVATVRLSTPTTTATATASDPSLQNIHSEAFRSARRALDRALSPENPTTEADEEFLAPLLPVIPPEADSAHVTGFHHAGGMSRYNVRREGMVFSDQDCYWNTNANDEPNPNYLSNLSKMFWSLHGIAHRVLLAIETKLELPCEDPLPAKACDGPEEKEIDGEANGNFEQQQIGWFQKHLGPTATSSQWHMKRFVMGEEEEDEQQQQEDRANESKDCAKPATVLRTETGERISLPMHTDPSLISVVVHDSHGGRIETNHEESTNEALGALGLQYFHPKKQQWEEPEAHGHLVATVFVGSVLAHLTCGQFPAAKHRVVETRTKEGPLPKRMAATLFVRPQPSALLTVPLPSPWLLQRLEEEEAQRNTSGSGNHAKKKKSFAKPPITFDAWLKRVAKNYEKQKKKQKNKPKKVP